MSTRYTLRLGVVLDARKIFVATDVRNRYQDVSQMTLARPTQRAPKYFAVLGLGATAVLCRSLLERENQRRVDVAYD
jgi:hypothetical protein